MPTLDRAILERGRRPFTPEQEAQIRYYLARGVGPSRLASELHICRRRLYRWIAENGLLGAGEARAAEGGK